MKPKAFPLLKQGSVAAGGMADGALARAGGASVRHAVAERWDKAGERM